MTGQTAQKPWNKMMSRHPDNDPLDFFATPPLTTLALFTQFTRDEDPLDFNLHIWEPACGDGAMSKVMIALDFQVTSTDIKHYGWKGQHSVLDFMVAGAHEPRLNDIITNPPYSIHLQWIKKSLAVAKRYVALLFPLIYLPPKNKRHWITEVCQFELVVPGWRSRFIMPGRTKASGMKDYAWFVWDKEKPASRSFKTTIVEKDEAIKMAKEHDISW